MPTLERNFLIEAMTCTQNIAARAHVVGIIRNKGRDSAEISTGVGDDSVSWRP